MIKIYCTALFGFLFYYNAISQCTFSGASITALENSCTVNDDRVLSGTSVTLTGNGGNNYLWTTSGGSPGVYFEYYLGDYNVLPDFNTLTPVRTGLISNFNIAIPSRPSNDYFAMRFRGYINIANAGSYTFFTNSDDGSKLYINGVEIINNDGVHPATERSSARITLTRGLHQIEATFFEKTVGEVFDVSYQGPGIAKQIIPNSVLFPNAPSIVVTPTTTTTYTVTAINASGCTSTASKTISVVTAPSTTITSLESSCTVNDDRVLSGSLVSMTATGTGTFTWNNGLGTGSRKTPTLLETTTYTATITDANGCTASADKTITVVSAPSTSITATETSCTSNDDRVLRSAIVTLSASGTGTFAWNNALGAGSSKTVAPIVTTTYTATITDANGCTANASKTISIITAPSTSITSTEASCTPNDDRVLNGAPVTLTATGAGTYAWSTTGTGSNITVSPLASTVYTATLTDANGCAATASKTITVVTAPSTAITATETSCTSNDDRVLSGAPVTLIASGVGTFMWNNALGAGSIKAVTPTATTTYIVTVTDANGCTSTANKNITIVTLPSTTITATETSCTPNDDRVASGTSVTLSASGTGTFTWNNGLGTGSNKTAAPTVTTTYTATITDAFGCIANNSKTITIVPPPTASAGADQSLCNTSFSLIGNTPIGLQTGSWSVVSGTATFSTTTSPATTVTVSAGTTATLRWTVREGACVASDDVVVNSVAALAGVDQTFCSQATYTMAANIPLAGTGSWSIVSGLPTISNINSATASVTVPAGTSVTLRWSVNTGICGVLTDDVVLTNFQSFSISAGADISQCNNADFNVSNGIVANVACAANAAVLNGGFESPTQAPNTYSLVNQSAVLGWKTTASDNMIEVWGTGFNSVPSKEGNQFVELNANITSGLYQDLCVLPGDSITWSVAHRGRAGRDSMVIKIGMPGALIQQRRVGTGNTAWVVYTGSYKVPAGQTVTRFQFEALSTATGDNSVGNFIDEVKINLISRTPIPGSWSIVSGTGTISSPTSPITKVTGVPVGTSVVLRYTGNNGICSASDDIILTNNAIPTIAITATETSCTPNDDKVLSSGNVALTASGTGTFAWNNALGTGSSKTVAPTATTTYTATITDANGCTATASKTIAVVTAPSTIITATESSCTSNDDKILSGSSVTLSASGTGTYAWSTATTTSSVTVTPSATTTYTVTYTDANGCTATASKTITVITAPSTSITATEMSCTSNDDQVLSGSNVLLSAIGTGTYAWNTTAATTSSITVTPSATSTYTVTLTDTDGCTATASKTITVITAPSTAITATEVSCVSNDDKVISAADVTLEATGGLNYTWGGGLGTGATKSQKPTATTTYTVTLTDANGCTATASKTIYIITLPATFVLANEPILNAASLSNICPSATANLSTVTATNTPTSASFEWHSSETPSTATKITDLTAVNTGQYYATFFEPINKCYSATTPLTATVKPCCIAGNDVPVLNTTSVGNICPALTIDLSSVTASNLPIGTILEFHSSASPVATTLVNGISNVNIGTYYATFRDLANNCYSPTTAVDANSTSCAIKPITSGNDGGLESDGCLAEAIAQRNYSRIKTPSVSADGNVISFDNPSDLQLFIEPSKGGLQTRGENDLESFIPQKPFATATTARITSPTDLIGITNAKRVVSVDYFDNTSKRRLAAILSTQTKEGAYNHTKVICDRLIGASLLSSQRIDIDGKPFILSVLQRENGVVEYNINFSVNKESATSVLVTSQWSPEQYLLKADYWNFQVWAESSASAKKLALEILNKFKEQYPIILNTVQPSIPKVYVKNGKYDNGILTLNIQNPIAATQITLTGNYTNSETQKRNTLNKTITLSGAKEEIIEVYVGGIFDFGFNMKNNKAPEYDALYFADGVWGLDYNKLISNVDNFDVKSTIPFGQSGVYTLERNPTVRGTVKDYVSLFRTLRPASVEADMSGYQNLSFTASGNSVVEVTLVKKSITDWSKQYRTEVRLFNDNQDYTIPLKDFSNGSNEEIDATDLVDVVFTIKGDGKTAKPFEISIENLVFDNKARQRVAVESGKLIAYPNPAKEMTELIFDLPERGVTQISLTNIQGQSMILRTEELAKGTNRVLLPLEGFPSGMYIATIITAKNKMSSKIVIP